MIVVSASLKKSGSGWLFNMTNDLLAVAGHDDVRALRDRYGLDRVLRGENCLLNPRLGNLWPLYRLHRQGHRFVVKTHAGPSAGLWALRSLQAVRVTYIYRDPRDVVVSALDHGTRLRADGTPNALADLHTVEDAALYVKRLLADWQAWDRVPGVCMMRYEDLIADTEGQLVRVADHLGLSVSPETIGEVVARYDAGRLEGVDRHRLHFNQGGVERYREAMSSAELSTCEQHLGSFLRRMGYAAS